MERQPHARARRGCGRRAGSGSGRRGRTGSGPCSHGSRTRSGRRRSEANRSSGLGQADSSAPSRWARSTRLSTRAASPSSASRAPSASGPSRSRRRPRTERGGRGFAPDRREREPGAGAQAPFLDERPNATGGVPLEPAQGRGARAAGDDELGPAVGSDPRDGRPALADGDREVGGEPARPRSARRRAGCRGPSGAATDAAGRPRPNRPAPRASGRARCRPAGRGWPGARRRGRSRSRRPSSGCWRGLRASRRRRRGRTPDGRPAWPAGGTRSPARPARSGRADLGHERAEASTERCIVGRPRFDADVVGPGVAETGLVPLGDRPAGVGQESLQRSCRRAGLRMQDADDDAGHPASLARVEGPPMGRVRAYVGLGANLGDAEATLARGGPRPGGAPRRAPPRGLAPLRDRSLGRDRPARVPQRGRGPRRAVRSRSGRPGPWRC